MGRDRIANLRRSIEAFFPERHLYVRSGSDVKAFVLTTKRQIGYAAIVAFCALWMGVTTGAMALDAVSTGNAEQALAKERARTERWVADREARLNSAVAQLSNGSAEQLAVSVEKRQAALAMLIGELKGEPAVAQIVTAGLPVTAGAPALDRIRAVSSDTDRLVAQAEMTAKTRADRLRLALRLAGLDPAAYARGADGALGGPLIEAKDPRALAAVLDVDEDFARRIQRAANDMAALRAMNAAAQKLPLAQPAQASRSGGFGVRLDPFTRAPAYHSGMDFAAPLGTPIHAAGPGVVAFSGVRSGYGNVVEIDHGGGFKTRYAHLQAISVATGQRVAVGTRIGGMGSTGRSTGSHLHYEVWVNGRAQNPDRFLRAGSYVQQTN